MQRLPYFFMLLLLVFTACSDDDDDGNQPITDDALKETLTEGNWRITLFQEEDEVHTADFSGYTFSFQSNGNAVASNGTENHNGSWQTGTDDSRQKLMLNFGTANPWEELNEDWHVLEHTSSLIRLEHESGGDGSLDLLTFER